MAKREIPKFSVANETFLMKKSRKLIRQAFLTTTAADSPLFPGMWWGGKSPGTFLKAAPVNQSILLGGVALRVDKKVEMILKKWRSPMGQKPMNF